jgi:hypothetical protein
MKINSFDNPLLYKLYLMLSAPDTYLINLDYQFSQEFNQLRTFTQSIQNLLDQQSKEIQTKMESEEKKYENDPQSLDQIAQHFGNDLYSNDFIYRKMLMNMTYVSAVSLFEAFFKKLCLALSPELGKTIDDVRSGSGNISRYRKYMQQCAGLELQSIEKIWQRITIYNEIRNLIVHEYADVAKEKTKPHHKQIIYRFIAASPHITIDESERDMVFYINNYEFILDFMITGETYLTEIFKMIRIKLCEVQVGSGNGEELKRSKTVKKKK